MKSEFVRCEYCKADLVGEACILAAYRTVVEGKEYLFCCMKCAERYKKKKRK